MWQPCQRDKEECIDHPTCFSFFTYLLALLSFLSVVLEPWHFRLPGDAVCQAVAMVTAGHFAALAVPELFSCRGGVSEGGRAREKKPTCWFPANWLFLFFARSVPSSAILFQSNLFLFFVFFAMHSLPAFSPSFICFFFPKTRSHWSQWVVHTLQCGTLLLYLLLHTKWSNGKQQASRLRRKAIKRRIRISEPVPLPLPKLMIFTLKKKSAPSSLFP